jgi:hypothetical protein
MSCGVFYYVQTISAVYNQKNISDEVEKHSKGKSYLKETQLISRSAFIYL